MALLVSKRKLKGSVLGFSLILLSLFLISGITVLSVAVLGAKNGFAMQKSIIAFQAADSSAERVLKRIYIDNSPALATAPLNTVMPDQDLNELASNLSEVAAASTDCVDASSQINGLNSPVTSPQYTFQVIFYDKDGARISCTDQAWRDKLIWISSEGSYQRTSRVIEIGIRPRT